MPTAPEASDALLAALRAALAQQRHSWADALLEPLPDKGLAHDHVRLAGTGALARIPKQSQMRLAPAENLAYQAACFGRAAASGQVPRLLGQLPPSIHLPRGALLVEEIVGRPAQLPADLDAIAQALAAIHSLPLPNGQMRAPLINATDALADLVDEIAAQARHLDAAGVAPAVLRQVDQQISFLHSVGAALDRPPRQLIAFDGHPGNFIVRGDGRAILVDLEKCRYSYSGLDLAHATLYTSTTWDIASHAVLSLPQVLQFHATWAASVGEAAAAAAQPWHMPLRRAMWLWSLTWCAKWRALSGRAAKKGAQGEDWSAARSDAALVDHVRERVDHYLSPGMVTQVLDEFEALGRAPLFR